MAVRTGLPTLRERLRTATGEAILAAAEETLVERGSGGAGINEIASRAGVSVGTLYNHFKDREALLEALMEARGKSVVSRIDEALARVDAEPFRDRVAAVASAIFAHMEEHRGLMRIVLDEKSPCPSEPDAARRRSIHDQLLERVERLMKAGVKDGTLRRDGAKLYAFMFLGQLRGGFEYMLRAEESPGSASFLAELVTRTFVDGAAKR